MLERVCSRTGPQALVPAPLLAWPSKHSTADPPPPTPHPHPPPSRLQALRKPWRMQLVRELSFGHRVTPGSLSEWQAAHEQALREGVFLN